MVKPVRLALFGCLLLVAAVVGVWLAIGRGDEEEVVAEDATEEIKVAESVECVRPVLKCESCAVDPREVAPDESERVLDAWVEELPVEDRALGQAIVDASDNEDLAALRRVVGEARKSKNAAVRLRMVEALGWFGKDAVVELAMFIVDADTEVAKAAFSEWDAAVDQVDDEKFGVEASVSAMKVLTDEDDLSCAACRIEGAYDRRAAIKAIIEIVGCDNPPGAKAAKEAYEFITGDEWTGVEAAAAKAETINDGE